MLTVTANIRTKKKTAASRKLRKKNKCPAVIYRNNKDPNLIISLNYNEIQHPKISCNFHKNKIFKLIINKDTVFVVKIHDIQYHPFKLKIIHVDFIII